VCNSVTDAIRRARLVGVTREELREILEREWR